MLVTGHLTSIFKSFKHSRCVHKLITEDILSLQKYQDPHTTFMSFYTIPYFKSSILYCSFKQNILSFIVFWVLAIVHLKRGFIVKTPLSKLLFQTTISIEK